MKKCKSCRMEIDTQAKKCLHCQTDQLNWFVRHPFISGILFLMVLGWLTGLIVKSDSNQEKTSASADETSQANKQPTAAPTPLAITARDLADEFDSNQVDAEAKWKDKLVKFSAQISNITDSGLSFYNVASKEFSLTQISCRIENKDQLMPLKNSQTVTVSGVVGTQTMGVIDIKQCEIAD